MEFVRLRIFAKPRASRSRILGLHGDALAVQLAAPPVDGAANAALVALLADFFAIPRSAVQVERGVGGRHKIVRLEGAPPIPPEWAAASAGRG